MIQSHDSFKNLEFKGTWRSYQQKILDELQKHISDDKLHIVAAPGAGKTILGLEILRRLGKPCLILAPTITIKNQWGLRIKQSFMADKSVADEIISLNIFDPKIITISTYQGLLAALCGQKETQEDSDQTELDDENENLPKSKQLSRFNEVKAQKFIQILQKAKIKILCFDEAHHLRNEWWKALDYIMTELKPSQTLSLTATPPYDVEAGEWERYEALCGPVDASISIPELVKNKDLCPHQDLLYFCPLRNTEKEVYNKYQSDSQGFLSDFLTNTDFAKEVYELEIWSAPNKYMELFYEDPNFYIACASLFKFHNFTIHPEFLKLFDSKQEDIPELSSDQINTLLNGFLFKYRENYQTLEPLLAKIQRSASEAGLIYRQSVCIDNNPRILKMMAHSLGKLDAIEEIAKTESKKLKENLRMVILADYIRRDYLTTNKETLGVIPIFKRLDAIKLKDVQICVLTGQIILIPVSVKQFLLDLMKQSNLNSDAVSFNTLKQNTNYLQVSAKEKAKSKIVFLITELFNQGHLHIMVGTQALLGEGWDAPSINSLILSNAVASYMLSNQMRGRAIRIDKTNPNKVSHIWHLANVQTSSSWSVLNSVVHTTGDLIQLKRRFEGYQAPQLISPYTIQSGLERCYGKLKSPISQVDFEKITKNSLDYTREETKLAWEKGLVSKDAWNSPRLKQKLDTKQQNVKHFVDGYIVKLSMATYFAIQASYTCVQLKLPAIIFIPIWLAWLAFMTPSTLRILRTGKPYGYLKQISLVILESLFDSDLISTNPQMVKLDIHNNTNANYSVSVDKLDQREQDIFLHALSEFLSPIENPRYILIRKNLLAKIFKQVDYHAIPFILGSNKTMVMSFKKHWNRRIGSCNIIYTRNIAGHRILLQAKMNAYSRINNPVKKITKWE